MGRDGARVAVIGGGVSGLTTATLLQANGYNTTLYALHRPPSKPTESRPGPGFASVHAAASILPHSVSSPRAAHWTTVSQEYFRILAFSARCGVREQTHYEIFEESVSSIPNYLSSFPSFIPVNELDQKLNNIPRRNSSMEIFGWQLRIYFCEAPVYLNFLSEVYTRFGGTIASREAIPGTGELTDYLGLGFAFFVNCAGHSSIRLLQKAIDSGVEDNPDAPSFEPLVDPFEPKFYRGHYLKLDIRTLLTDTEGRFLSYNYTPVPEIYQTPSGQPADVYCYPRTDCWILGGSRQELPRSFKVDERWETDSAELAKMAIRIPGPILTLNDQILNVMTGGAVNLQRTAQERPNSLMPGVGLRFVRSSLNDSVRLSCSRIKYGTEKYVLHNYGHGGSGYTLSWGCALDVLRLIENITEPPRPRLRTATFSADHEAIGEMLVGLTDRLRP